jgi:hypothetical protein
VADEFDPKQPNEEESRPNEEGISGSAAEEEEFEDIDEMDDDEGELES